MAGQGVERIRLCICRDSLHILSIIDYRKHIAAASPMRTKAKVPLICYSQLPVTGQLGIVQLDVNDSHRLQVGDAQKQAEKWLCMWEDSPGLPAVWDDLRTWRAPI